MEDEECNKKYDALAGTMNIEDISSNEDNQEILRRLKENDPTFTNLCICNQNQIEDEFEFCPNKFDFCPTKTGRSWDGWDIFLAKAQLWTSYTSVRLLPHLATLALRISAEDWDETGRSEVYLSIGMVDWMGRFFICWTYSSKILTTIYLKSMWTVVFWELRAVACFRLCLGHANLCRLSFCTTI